MTGRAFLRRTCLALLLGVAGGTLAAIVDDDRSNGAPLPPDAPSLPAQPCGPAVRVALAGVDGATVPTDAESWVRELVTGTGRTVEVNPPDTGTALPTLFVLAWRPATAAVFDVTLEAGPPSTGTVDYVIRADIATGSSVTSEADQRATVGTWWATALPPCSSASDSPSPSSSTGSPSPSSPAATPTPGPTDSAGDDAAVWVAPDDGHLPSPFPDLAAVDPHDPAPVDAGDPPTGPAGIVIERPDPDGRPGWVPRPLWAAYATAFGVLFGLSWAPRIAHGWPALALLCFVAFGAANLARAGRQDAAVPGHSPVDDRGPR
ncbi:hypothetical protein [Cryptosporangium aurantiacum]|uniref:Uncharacterized protein n=1 Tax=Cryptosporangium aurantiacum TaxID=134849 RepID=A0A1M7RPK8_9ACTN|nr:hypothetical protein [Cryptosporangium aurantiacum]SHN48204.1 hypothetical protein SAMN05443668_13622 [Cryptosporangium aurantiacum]